MLFVPYTVKFRSEGTVIDSKTVNEGDAVQQPTGPTRDVYTFDGWYLDEATTQEYDFTTATVTTDMTLYAKWAAAVANGFLIPDVNFRTYLKEFISNAFDDEYMDTTHVDVLGLTSLDVAEKSISSLAGIEYFTTLDTLICAANSLTALDVTRNTTLIELNCSYDKLTSSDVTQNKALAWLNCESNQLDNLDLRGIKSFSPLIINAQGSVDGTVTNPITQLYVHTNLQIYAEIREAKRNRGTVIAISTYDDANTQVCTDFYPNEGKTGIFLSSSGAKTLEGLASNTSPTVPADLGNYFKLMQDIRSPHPMEATLVLNF